VGHPPCVPGAIAAHHTSASDPKIQSRAGWELPACRVNSTDLYRLRQARRQKYLSAGVFLCMAREALGVIVPIWGVDEDGTFRYNGRSRECGSALWSYRTSQHHMTGPFFARWHFPGALLSQRYHAVSPEKDCPICPRLLLRRWLVCACLI
jgi:hypothetical protein